MLKHATNHFPCMSFSPAAAKQDESQASWRCSALLSTARCISERIINTANAHSSHKLPLKHLFCFGLTSVSVNIISSCFSCVWAALIAKIWLQYFKQLIIRQSREKSKCHLVVVGILFFLQSKCICVISDDDSVVLSATWQELQHNSMILVQNQS